MRAHARWLLFVLSFVMLLILCASSALALDFADADDIYYAKAVSVLSDVGVINGIDNNGILEFQPSGTLTRAQAAKIIAYLLKADESELASESGFSDCRGHWAEGPIAYAAAKGIVAGLGDGNYNPEGKLSGFAFAKMLLCAIGYDAEAEEMLGDDWAVSVIILAKKAGIIDDISGFDGLADCSREQACQMAYNAMKADLVAYTFSGSIYSTGKTLYKDVFGLEDDDISDAAKINSPVPVKFNH